MNSPLRYLKQFSLTLFLLISFSCSPEDIDTTEENNTETDISGDDNGNDTPYETTDGDTPDDDNETDPDVIVTKGAVNTYGNLQVSENKIISKIRERLYNLEECLFFGVNGLKGLLFVIKILLTT